MSRCEACQGMGDVLRVTGFERCGACDGEGHGAASATATSDDAVEAVARIFGEDYAWPWDERSRDRYREKARRAIDAIDSRRKQVSQ